MSFEIVDATPVVKTVKYADAVDALKAAGEGKAIRLTVPRGTKRDGTPVDAGKGGGKDRIAFQQAANAAGYTARVRLISEDDAEQTAVLEFTLTEQHKRGRKAEAKAEAETEAPAEVEAEAPAEAEAEAAPVEGFAPEGEAQPRRGFRR